VNCRRKKENQAEKKQFLRVKKCYLLMVVGVHGAGMGGKRLDKNDTKESKVKRRGNVVGGHSPRAPPGNSARAEKY